VKAMFGDDLFINVMMYLMLGDLAFVFFYGICKLIYDYRQAKLDGNEKEKGEIQLLAWRFVIIIIIFILIYFFSTPYRM
jgi:heme/copper-type cytochrome/quinol oxidase subunit 2